MLPSSASFEQASELAQGGRISAACGLLVRQTPGAQGLTAESEQAWASAAASDPTGFYSERAADILAGRGPFEPTGLFTFPTDLGADRLEAEEWLRANFPITATGDLNELSESLAGDPRHVRGTELLTLGLYDEARAEFEDLRLDYADDAESTYRLMHRFLALGLYDLAIRSARQVLDLTGLDDAGTLSAPRYFNLIRFGPYFGDLILPEALSAELDPLFLLSVVRQESLFQGAATSSASARGLMQVIPSTGAAIAAELGWPPDYSEADLHRPIVSVRFGTHYLKSSSGTLDET
jgi:soluble lytic murein transglycosylase